MNLKKIILLFLLFIGIKASAQVVPVIPQWRMDTSKDSLSFSIPGMAGSKWIWDSRLLRVKLLNKADSVDWYVTHTALSDTLAGHLAVAKYPVIFIGDTITADISGSLSPNAIISGGESGIYINAVPDTFLAVNPVTYRLNNIVYSTSSTNYFHLPPRSGTQYKYGYVYANTLGVLNITYSSFADTPVPPVIPIGTLFIGSVLISPDGDFAGGGGPGVTTLYTGDGNLFSNRTVNGDGHWLQFYMPHGFGHTRLLLDSVGGIQFDTDDFLDSGAGIEFRGDSLGGNFRYHDTDGNTTSFNIGKSTLRGSGIGIQLPNDTTAMYYNSASYETAIRAIPTGIPDNTIVQAKIDSSITTSSFPLSLSGNTTINLNGYSLTFAGGLTPPLAIDANGVLTFGSFAYSAASYITDQTLAANSTSSIELDPSSNNITISLPDVSTVEPGKVFIFKRITGTVHSLNIHPFTTQTIDGSASNLSMPNQWDWLIITGNGDQDGWNIIGRNSNGIFVPYTGATANINLNTRSITQGTGSGGIIAYNTADQTTNYERFMASWQSNFYEMGMDFGGTGLLRGLKIGYSSGAGSNPLTRYLLISNNNVQFDFVGSTIGDSLAVFTNLAHLTSTASTALSSMAAINPTINQTSTAGYRGLWISPFEQALGSGVHLLIDAGTNSAANGSGVHTSKFTVDDLGNVNSVSVRATAVAFANLPASPVEGMMVPVTNSNTNVWGATIAGGGANHVLAYYNGTNWTVMGK